MVRNYKRKTTPIDKKTLENAIKAVKDGQTVRKAAKQFGLNHSTLHTHVNRRETEKHQPTKHKAEIANAVAAVRGGEAIISAAKNFGLNYETLRSHVEILEGAKPHYKVNFIADFFFRFRVSIH